MILGDEIIINGSFDTGTFDQDAGYIVADGWQPSDNGNGYWPQANGKVSFVYVANQNDLYSDYGTLWQTTNYDPVPITDPVGRLIHNHTYQVQFTIGGGNTLPNQYVYVALGEVLNFQSSYFPVPVTDGRVTLYMVAHTNLVGGPGIGTQGIFFQMGHLNCTVTLDDVSVREVLENLPLSGELISNGNFQTSSIHWTLGANWTYGSGKITKTNGSGRTFSQTLQGLKANAMYLISLDAGSSGNPDLIRDQVAILSNDDFYSDDVDPRQPQVAKFIVSTSDDGGLFFNPFTTKLFTVSTSADFAGTMDNISVREVIQEGELPTYSPSIITSVKKVAQNLPFPQYIISGKGDPNGSTYKLFKKDDEYNFTVWRSPVYKIGKDFDIMGIEFNVIGGVIGNKEIIPVLRFDDERDESVGNAINVTNYPNLEKLIRLTSKNFNNSVTGQSNFYLELQFTGTELAVVSIPINIEIEEHEN